MFNLFKKRVPTPPLISPVIDLGRFTCDAFQIGQAFPKQSPLTNFFSKCDNDTGAKIYKNLPSGLQISMKDDHIDCIFIALKSFSGSFELNGEAIVLNTRTTESEVFRIFGEPWWKHVADDLEVIDFYEHHQRNVEIQFEYPALCQLEFITILRNGILSDPEQRKSYEVNKPWPPHP